MSNFLQPILYCRPFSLTNSRNFSLDKILGNMPGLAFFEKVHFEKKSCLNRGHLRRMAASGQAMFRRLFLFTILNTLFLVYNSRYIRFADSILSSQAMLRNSIFVKDSLNLLVDLVFRHFFSWWTAAKISMRAYIFLLSL